MKYQDFYTNFQKGIYPTELSKESKNSLFLSSCANRHLEVAQWLWSISNEMIDIHADSEYAFRWSCENGYLEVAQWLWSISNEIIDIHAEDEWAFRWSCQQGYLEIAQWLWSISNRTIDIYAKNEWAFRMSCINGHLEVAQWLRSISNKSIDKYKVPKKPRYYQNSDEIITIQYIKHYYYKPYTGPGYLHAIRED
jgi:hypothetical protein